ncbi:hypothetical protein NDU88_001065 [Pleurodeles waltl]|uniref:Uncharacterized protein n=1 Tax=Pleurodeles waltl TaxID=8319 RepID=A0AAV7RBJ5_PLEWA|nr:hypothetical protein NDU88_001065 [Pleurodeles waltl]
MRRPLPSRPSLPSRRSCSRHGEEGRIRVQTAQYTGACLGHGSVRLGNLAAAAASGVLHPPGPPGERLLPQLSRPNLPSRRSCPRHCEEGRIRAQPAQYFGGRSRRSGEPSAQNAEEQRAAGGCCLLLLDAH